MNKLFLIFLFPLSVIADDFYLVPPPSLSSNPKKVVAYWSHSIQEYLIENEEKFLNVEKKFGNVPFECGYCMGFREAMKMMDKCLSYQDANN